MTMDDDEDRAHIDRIVERMRKDHPDPKMREDIDWIDYVRAVMPDGGRDDDQVKRIAAAVRAASVE
jgi:hypothetical protein